MIGIKAAPVIIFTAIVGIFGLALKTGDPTRLPSTMIGKPVPQRDYPAIEGLVENERPVPGFTQKDLATGKVILVNFWASWCVACIAEHPKLVAMRKRGIPIYGVNYKDQAGAARRFLGRLGNPYSKVGTDRSGRSAVDWGVYGMPESFIINGKGEIVYKHIGPISRSDMEKKILPLIEQARGNKDKGS